ncbi:MarR family winged helix-turn-helix transcriptional regulator [Pandoraea sp. NPDC087047]|uniref:MarR family winged helix-turn-helix transcriptional regulator n=1 Tax=Pandoraea sp. NPDC087047 TaxID=3364390 RepID=UPI00381325D2
MATSTPLDEKLSSRVTTGLLRMGTALRSHAWEGAALSGLTPTQGEILTLLLLRGVPMRLGKIAEDAALTSATVSEAVSTLESKGLVEKRRDANDGRALGLRLTTKGRTSAKRASQWASFVTTAADLMSDKDRAQLYRMLLKLISTMEIRGDMTRQRMCLTCEHLETAARGKGMYHCNYFNTTFDDSRLAIDCNAHEEASIATRNKIWKLYSKS